MKRERRRHAAAFKAKVALEAIKAQRTVNEIAASEVAVMAMERRGRVVQSEECANCESRRSEPQ